MDTAGIVAEYNPFHTGHMAHIAALRAALGPCRVVAVMSGNWVQRGECAVADKWARAEAAVRGGVDLVLELPTVWAASSAEAFARGAVAHLAAAGVVNTLSFGSECGDGTRLARLAACLDSPAYSSALSPLLRQGISFAACRQQAAEDVVGAEEASLLSNPNDNLGVEYLRSAAALGWTPRVVPVRRMGAGHHAAAPQEGHASATTLRGWLRQGQADRAAPFLPTPWPPERPPAHLAWAERAILCRLRSMEPEDWRALPDAAPEEGLPHRLTRGARQARSLEEFYARTATRRYPLARLRRLVVWAFLELTAAQRPAEPQYLRVLAFNGAGRELLREISAAAKVPVLTRGADLRALSGAGEALFRAECRCTNRYSLCLPEPEPCGLEWTAGVRALP